MLPAQSVSARQGSPTFAVELPRVGGAQSPLLRSQSPSRAQSPVLAPGPRATQLWPEGQLEEPTVQFVVVVTGQSLFLLHPAPRQIALPPKPAARV